MLLAKIPMLLVSLAAGYGVLVLSQGQQRPLNGLGRFIGGLILIGSLAGLLCIAVVAVWCGFGKCDGMKHCGPMDGRKCPFTMKSEAPADVQAPAPQQ